MRRITESDIETASRVDDLDAALLPIMDAAGIDDGGIASLCFSGFDWETATLDARAAQLRYWLRVELIP